MRLNAEHRNRTLIIYTGAALLLLLGCATYIIYSRYRYNQKLFRLNYTITKLRAIRDESLSDTIQAVPALESGNDIEALRTRLKSEINLLEQRAHDSTPSPLLATAAHAKLMDYVNGNRVIVSKSPFWEEIESAVAEFYPQFKSRLLYLSDNELKPDLYHLALLIKMGITPTDTCILVGKTKGTVSYWRKNLLKSLLNEDLSSRQLDSLINIL